MVLWDFNALNKFKNLFSILRHSNLLCLLPTLYFTQRVFVSRAHWSLKFQNHAGLFVSCVSFPMFVFRSLMTFSFELPQSKGKNPGFFKMSAF